MQNFAIYRNGHHRYSNANGSWLYTDGNMSRSIVQSGGITQGNFRDPNGWWYSVEHSKHMYCSAWGSRYPYNPDWTVTESGYYPGSPPPAKPEWERDALYNQALNRLNERVRGGLDLGVSLAEAGQTARMTGALARVLTFARNPASWHRPGQGRGPSGLGTTQDVANGWLQWQYGWRPLFNDVFGAADEALNIATKTISSVKGSAKRPVKGLGVIDRGNFLGRQDWKWINTATGSQACTIRLVVELPGATLDRWSSLNPVSLGWELVPYSFVVDWFYDVGSFLRNAETALLYDSRFLKGYVSEVFGADIEEISLAEEKFFPTANPPRIDYQSGSVATSKVRKFYRTVLTSYPLPRPPTFRGSLGSEQLFSAAALLRQILGKQKF